MPPYLRYLSTHLGPYQQSATLPGTNNEQKRHLVTMSQGGWGSETVETTVDAFLECVAR